MRSYKERSVYLHAYLPFSEVFISQPDNGLVSGPKHVLVLINE
jgi:hypothetical protein